jgi:hypothetical protein
LLWQVPHACDFPADVDRQSSHQYLCFFPSFTFKCIKAFMPRVMASPQHIMNVLLHILASRASNETFLNIVWTLSPFSLRIKVFLSRIKAAQYRAEAFVPYFKVLHHRVVKSTTSEFWHLSCQR